MVNQIVAGIVVMLSVSMLSEGNMDFKGLLSNQDIFSNAPKVWHEYVKKLFSVSIKRNSLNEYNVRRFITEQKMFVLSFQLWQNQGSGVSLDDMSSWFIEQLEKFPSMHQSIGINLEQQYHGASSLIQDSLSISLFLN